MWFQAKISTEYAGTILLDDIQRSVGKDQLVGAVFITLVRHLIPLAKPYYLKSLHFTE